MQIDIVVDDKAILNQLAGLEGQFKFAMTVGLNQTANDVQGAIRSSLGQKFTLRRREWILNTIKREARDKATKENLVAVVRVDPTRNLLAKFEEGELKVGRGGHRVAIPTQNIRRSKADIVPTSQRPRALLNLGKAAATGKVFLKGSRILKSVGRGASATIKTLYVLVPGVRIPKRLGFVQTATETADRVWIRNASAAVDKAISTMR